MQANYPESFVDTNIIVRYLTGEPPQQAAEAVRIIREGQNLWLPDVVFTETAYVLGNRYGFPREFIIDHMIALVEMDNISVYAMDKSIVLEGLMMCRPSGRVSVADAMIWAAARSAEARTIYTFDRRFPSDGIELRQEL